MRFFLIKTAGSALRVCLRVEVIENVSPCDVESDLAPEFIESSMGRVVIFQHLSVSSVAERSVGGVLALTDSVISAFRDVECDRSVSCHLPVAKGIAPRGVL